MKAHIGRMLRAMAWSDRQVLSAVPRDLAMPGEVLPLLSHLLAAEHVWLLRLRRRETRWPVWPDLTLAECERLAGENAAGYAGLLLCLTDADLHVAIPWRGIDSFRCRHGTGVRQPTTRGEEFATPVIDILTHVVIHGAYHRGQIAKAFRRAGILPVRTDYIDFVRKMEPAFA
jgi:uncharacterized damage-inducible protein DinB